MADFTLGLAKTAVEGTLSRVQFAIDEEDKQKKAAQQDLVFITGEFQMMQSFLNVASKERARNEVVRTWVRQLRDLAFDVEDCVEFVIHLDNDSTWSWVWRLVPSCMVPRRTHDLDIAVAELKLLKVRVEEVSQRNTRYNLISDSNSNPVPESLAVQPGTTGPSTIDILMELWGANGKHRGLGNLEKLITNEGNDLQVISLWGSAGSDMEGAQIIDQAYCDPEICHTFKSRAWVKLMHPFNPDKFLKNLQTRLQASSRSCQAADYKGKISENDPMKQLTEQRYLVILEGIPSVVEWDIIKMYLPDNNNGSRIVVSTRKIRDAIFFTGSSYGVSVLREFTGGDYLCALFNKASDYYGYGNNKEVSRSIFLSNRMKVSGPIMQSQEKMTRYMLPCLQATMLISVWGIAGVGKSALVRETYDEIRDYSLIDLERFAWVDMPAGPFDLVEFSRLLLLEFHRHDLEAMEAAAIGIMQGLDPIQGCREILRQDGYLVIIDGLRSTCDWDLIESAFLSQPTTNGNIVVITTKENIAKHSVKQQAGQMFNVKCVDDDDAHVIFRKLLDPDGTQLARRMGKVHLSKLVAKCGGLPKVVSTIAKVLSCMEFSGPFLEHMNDDFMLKLETDPRFHSLSGLLSWMHSYFDACSDLVKPCIFYLSVFPASSKIRQGRLVRRWIAEGYSRNRPGCTAREDAQKRFSELVELSIIQQATSKVICQVNGFFREYIISRPMEDNLVFALDGRCNPNTQRTGQHLTIMANWHRDQIAFESIDFARLRSLTVFGEWYSFFISGKMRRLRVLDLEGMVALTNEDIEQIFVKLLSLKFISLRGCREISHLPDTLGGLRQLQTLDVRRTSIVKLPSAIIKLHKLQYIRAGPIVLPDDDWKSASTEDGDVVTSQLPATISEELEGRDSSVSSGRPAVPTCTENGIAESPAQATSQEAQHRPMLPKVGRLAHTWSLCGSKPKKEAQHHNGGVGVPVGIESLTALHTVGVVNVNASGGEAFLKQLAKLTQLLKLRVCGVNKKNWEQLCSALSDKNCHLESLSVRFDEDCFDDSFKPPKTLKSLKLYGPITRLPEVTMKVLVNLTKLDLEMTITSPDDIHLFLKDKLPRRDILNRLCIKVQGDKVVNFSSNEFDYDDDWSDCFQPRVVKIDCSSKLEVTVGVYIINSAEVLIIQCSEGSFFRVSGSGGLTALSHLNTVWLKGSYSQEQRQHLKELVDRHSNKPVLKLEPF